MTGYMMAMGPCFSCGHTFWFNPDYVPSHRDAHGEKQPFCQACIDAANPRRIANGLDPIVPHRLAYQPSDEVGNE